MENNMRNFTVFTAAVLFSLLVIHMAPTVQQVFMAMRQWISYIYILYPAQYKKPDTLWEHSSSVLVWCVAWICSVKSCYNLYFSNSMYPVSQWQYIYSTQISTCSTDRFINNDLALFIWREWRHEFACFDVWASFVLCVWFVCEFTVLWESRIKRLLFLCSFSLA